MKKFRPKDVLVAVTYRCNTQCKMCNIWAKDYIPELPAKEYGKIKNMDFVNISGGEPFLRNDIPDIVGYLTESKNKNIVICTNGLVKDTPQKIDEVLKVNPNVRITVAVDGIGKKHDEIRGVDHAFERVTNVLEHIQRSRVKKTRIGFTASNYNIDHLHQVYRLARQYGAELSLTAVYNSEIRYETVDNEITNTELFKVNFDKLINEELSQPGLKNWLRAYFAYGLYKYIETGKRILPKAGPAESVFVHADGRVILSVITGSDVGRLQDCENFTDLFQRQQAQSVIKEAEALPTTWHVYNVRPVIKKYPHKVLSWILKRKWELFRNPDKKILPNITGETKIAQILETYPAALDVLINMGFTPLQNEKMRSTVAKVITLEQAASFKGLSLDEIIKEILNTTADKASSHSPKKKPVIPDEKSNEYTPQLSGDLKVLGLVPCPIRSITIENLDAFFKNMTVRKGKAVSWWVTSEPGVKDVKPWITELVKERNAKKIPELIMCVGNEVFLYERYGKYLYDNNLLATVPAPNPRKELEPLFDPNKKLNLHYCVLFTMAVFPKQLPSGTVPMSWSDLGKPEYKGQIAIPNLDLPIIPDLLASLYYVMGHDTYYKFFENVTASQHPSEASPRMQRHDSPGICIVPYHFSRIHASTGATQVIPEEGAVAIPAYFAVKCNPKREAIEIAHFLYSKKFLEPCWNFGSFIPNNSDIPVDVDLNRIVTRPWDSLLRENPEQFTDQLIRELEDKNLT